MKHVSHEGAIQAIGKRLTFTDIQAQIKGTEQTFGTEITEKTEQTLESVPSEGEDATL